MADAETRTCKRCGETKPVDAYELQANGTPRVTCKVCRRARRDDLAHDAMLAQQERKAALADEMWSAMWTGRSRRALLAIHRHRTQTHRLKLRDGSGYISVSEMACRVAERCAVKRVANACKTYDDAQTAIRVLERDTIGRDRSREMAALVREASGDRDSPTLHPDAEDDPFTDAFGDWAPAWM
jgi:hypothetical protein